MVVLRPTVTERFGDVAAVKPEFVGVIRAEIWNEPLVAGLKVQVAVAVGAAPDVARARQPAIRLPLMKKRTLPGVSATTEIVAEIPL